MNKEKPEVKFRNIEDLNEEGYLWRYMDFHKFFSFILRKELFLTRNTLFEDKTESSQPIHHILNILKNGLDKDPILNVFDGMMHVDNFAEDKDQLEKELYRSQRSNFSNCWFYTTSDFESVAMWNLYSKPNGLAVKIKLKDFLELFETQRITLDRPAKILEMGPVKYINYQNINDLIYASHNIETFPFIKDISFSHEVEFRINVKIDLEELDESKFNENATEIQKQNIRDHINNFPGIRLEFSDFDKIPFQVKFHPKSDEWAKQDIRDLLKKYQMDFKIEDSKLLLR
jgi:hypothetical protein